MREGGSAPESAPPDHLLADRSAVAQEYVRWLSRERDQLYRLLSDAGAGVRGAGVDADCAVLWGEQVGTVRYEIRPAAGKADYLQRDASRPPILRAPRLLIHLHPGASP